MRREYVGGAQAARLTANLGGTTSDLTISCTDLTNWPTGIGAKPFYVVIDRGTASEEKILCSSRSGNTLTVYNVGGNIGRGADDTSITAHSNNAIIEHVFTATDADEANAHVNDTTGDPHPQYLNGTVLTSKGDLLSRSSSDYERVAVGANNLLLTADSGQPTGIKWASLSASQIPALTSTKVPAVDSNFQTDSYTLVLSDAGKVVEMDKATAQTLTIPLNSSVAFPNGTKIDVIQTGAGEATISPASGVTLNSEGSKRKINSQWQAVTLVKRGTDSWVLIGALKT